MIGGPPQKKNHGYGPVMNGQLIEFKQVKSGAHDDSSIHMHASACIVCGTRCAEQ